VVSQVDAQPHTTTALVSRPAEIRDLPQITRVHMAAFPGFFLSRLGPTFLEHHFYRIFLDAPEGILQVATAADRLVGFVAGCIDPEKFYPHIRARKLQMLPILLGRILCDPTLIRRILLNSRRVGNGGYGLKPYPGVSAELSSIAVDPTFSGKGVGRSLVNTFLACAATGGAGYVTLTTDTYENDRTNRFYEQLGFQRFNTFPQADGRVMNAYGIEVSPTTTRLPHVV